MIFIKGITHYKKYIRKALSKSKLVEGIDYIEGYASNEYALYWIKDTLTLKEFKRSIGAKYVWRHRIRFFESEEEMNKKKEIKENYEIST